MNAPLAQTQPAIATLQQVATGNQVTVVGIGGHGAVRRRLLEMGLCAGTTVEVIRRAPFGDPIEVRVRGYLLSMRNDQARLVQVAETGMRVSAQLMSA